MGIAKQIGAALPAIAPTDGTPSPGLSTTNSASMAWTLADLRNLPARLDEPMMASLELVASSAIPQAEPCPPDYFAKCIKAMDAALPRRQQESEDTAKLFIATYRKMLGHLTQEAMSHVTERAIATCKWFPTVAECLAFAKEFIQPPHPHREVREMARQLLRREKELRFKDALAQVEAGEMADEQIGALPERWRGIMAERGIIWALRDGTFTRRPQNVDEARARVAELIVAGLL